MDTPTGALSLAGMSRMGCAFRRLQLIAVIDCCLIDRKHELATTTFVAGLRQAGVVAPLVLDGPMNGAAFRDPDPQVGSYSGEPHSPPRFENGGQDDPAERASAGGSGQRGADRGKPLRHRGHRRGRASDGSAEAMAAGPEGSRAGRRADSRPPTHLRVGGGDGRREPADGGADPWSHPGTDHGGLRSPCRRAPCRNRREDRKHHRRGDEFSYRATAFASPRPPQARPLDLTSGCAGPEPPRNSGKDISRQYAHPM